MHKSSDQQSDYYSDENPKEHLDGQLTEVHQPEGISPRDEAKLYGKLLLKMRSIFSEWSVDIIEKRARLVREFVHAIRTKMQHLSM